jgi:hypothetical protein
MKVPEPKEYRKRKLASPREQGPPAASWRLRLRAWRRDGAGACRLTAGGHGANRP